MEKIPAILVWVVSNGKCPSGGVCDRESMVCLVQHMMEDGRKIDVDNPPRCPRYIDSISESKLRYAKEDVIQ